MATQQATDFMAVIQNFGIGDAAQLHNPSVRPTLNHWRGKSAEFIQPNIRLVIL